MIINVLKRYNFTDENSAVHMYDGVFLYGTLKNKSQIGDLYPVRQNGTFSI